MCSSDLLGRNLDNPPAEGRPPGQGWSHQRWEEFTPETYFQTATSGSRTNLGFRDRKQDHGYQAGEFGSLGLYHNTTGTPGRSEEHTSELQSRRNLVCRLLLEKKKNN